MKSLDPETNALLVSHRVGLSTAIPYAEALADAQQVVRIYCLGDFVNEAQALAPAGVAVVGPDQISIPRRATILKKATYLLSSLDPGDNPDQRQTFEHRAATAARLRRAIVKLTRRIPPNRLNAIIGRVASAFDGPLDESRIWVVSFLTEPCLALGREQTVISLMDSWDHPIRKTAGYRTDIAVGWNLDLAQDWAAFQGADETLAAAPLKLRYAADSFPLMPPQQRTLMFAVGTSSHTVTWQTAELHLAEMVCAAAAEAGWQVVLKLKPTGGQEDWLRFGERWDHVVITDEDPSSGPMDYYLSADYNERRLEELSRVRLVVNTVTTFGLDAACAGVPVLQLTGLDGPNLRGLASAQRNHHIAKYLLGDGRDLFQFSEHQGASSLASWLKSPDDRAEAYSRRLRRWLVPSNGFRAAVGDVVDHVCLPSGSSSMGIPDR